MVRALANPLSSQHLLVSLPYHVRLDLPVLSRLWRCGEGKTEVSNSEEVTLAVTPTYLTRKRLSWKCVLFLFWSWAPVIVLLQLPRKGRVCKQETKAVFYPATSEVTADRQSLKMSGLQDPSGRSPGIPAPLPSHRGRGLLSGILSAV